MLSTPSLRENKNAGQREGELAEHGAVTFLLSNKHFSQKRILKHTSLLHSTIAAVIQYAFSFNLHIHIEQIEK